jgi:hypothetical protein
MAELSFLLDNVDPNLLGELVVANDKLTLFVKLSAIVIKSMMSTNYYMRKGK